MSAENEVDASLAGLAQGELITIPPLPNKPDWDTFEKARAELLPNLSREVPAARYGVGRQAAGGEAPVFCA
jgi:hypothetical protein